MKHIFLFASLIIAASTWCGAQGPPITSDKPIMLAGNTSLIKNYSEFRFTERGNFRRIPLMYHFLPSSKVLLAVHVPYVTYEFISEEIPDGAGLGDIQIMAKYQLVRIDKKGKTFRVAAKTLQNLPTGKQLRIPGISTGEYEAYFGVVQGYETIKYGIGNEVGVNIDPGIRGSEILYRIGFGLPLLKPVYPVNQINLYFEYQNSWWPKNREYHLLYAQGIQYAKDQLTFDLAVQVPLVQHVLDPFTRRYSILTGVRYVF